MCETERIRFIYKKGDMRKTYKTILEQFYSVDYLNKFTSV